ncbi:MAG: hypothetical protein JSW03_07915 [Candidatus Eiseniibacteriota bacterium]|nr:MAG: hypothetical protein JSW03_07915 [Candidatus Eisenbacteria bacterium]
MRHVVALVILGTMFALGLVLSGGDSPTYDEPNHVASGCSYLKTGDFRMSLAQPPVGRMFLALPLLVVHPLFLWRTKAGERRTTGPSQESSCFAQGTTRT